MRASELPRGLTSDELRVFFSFFLFLGEGGKRGIFNRVEGRDTRGGYGENLWFWWWIFAEREGVELTILYRFSVDLLVTW